MIECACGCGRKFEPNPPGYGAPKKYFDVRCRARAAGRKRSLSGADATYKRRRRQAARGRVCKWCLISDKDRRWSLSVDECGNCQRQRAKRSCGKCGGPFYVAEHEVGCVRCLRTG